MSSESMAVNYFKKFNLVKILRQVNRETAVHCQRQITHIYQSEIPLLVPGKIEETLNEAQVTYQSGHTCFHIDKCDFCVPFKQKAQSTRSTEVYVNKQTGYFFCELCKCAGTWDILQRLLSARHIDKTVKVVTDLREGCSSYYEKGQTSWKKIANDNKLLHELAEDEEYFQVFKGMQLPEISRSVSEKLTIYVSVARDVIYLPIFAPNHLALGYIEVTSKTSYNVFPNRNCAGCLLYARRKHNTAIVVSSISDFFTLSSHTMQSNIICLPYGESHIPQITLPLLESYDSLTLWLGSSLNMLDKSRILAKKLNENRCSVIRFIGAHRSPSEAQAKGENILKIIEGAVPIFHPAITTFASLRKNVLHELVNYDTVLGIQWKRFPTLNKILQGHRLGELTVLTGPTGSGKTTFVSEYSLDLAMQGVNTLWGSFEVRNVRLIRKMLQQFVGEPLENKLEKFDAWADEFEKLPLFYLTFHGQQSINIVMEAVEHAVYVHDIAHVIIDNVQFMIGMGEETKYVDRFHKQDLIVHAFRQFATRCNVHVTLVMHPRKERESDSLSSTSIFGGAKAAQEADNVLILQDNRKGKKYLQVSKNRYTGHLGAMLLEFDENSLSFGWKKAESQDTNYLPIDVKKKNKRSK